MTILESFRLSNGLEFECAPKNVAAQTIKEVVDEKIYWPQPAYKPAPGHVIVDVGANIGLFSIMMSDLEPKCQIYAIEPAKQTFELLRHNIRKNQRYNIKAFQYAVTRAGGRRALYHGEHPESDSIFPGAQDLGSEEVPGITIDQFCLDQKITQIDYLKMDCEGAEYEILRDITTPISKMVIEAHPIRHGSEPQRLIWELERDGYDVWAYPHLGVNKMIYAIRRGLAPERFS